MTDDMQNMINQLSLVMTIPEDIVKACKQAEMPPAMTETMLRLHSQQVEMEKSIRNVIGQLVMLAQVIDQQANTTVAMHNIMQAISEHTGFNTDELVTSEEVGQDN